jgi:hypothetical protein
MNITDTGALELKNNAKLVNGAGGMVFLQSDGSIEFGIPNGGTIENAGLFSKQAGTSLSDVEVDFYNSGILDVETGTLAFTDILLNDTTGVISGSGTLDITSATFTNYGSFHPGASPGILVVNGDYPQTDTASLHIEIGGVTAGEEYDRLVVMGNAQLNGALDISFLNGFSPEVNDQFEVLFFNNRNGEFSSINYPDIGVGKDFDISYTSHSLLLSVVATGTQANLKVWLEGPYHVAGYMETTLNTGDLLPLNQPYSVAPWNYAGTEAVSAIPVGIVDWVLVELRSDITAVSSVAARAGWITNNGMIVDLDGVTPLTFKVPNGNYYAVVHHRNHLSIMSASALPLNAASAVYDFTTAQSQAYGTAATKELEPEVYGMIAGDANADGVINHVDRESIWRAQNGTLWTYAKTADFNLDAGIDANDLNSFWRNNQGLATYVPAASSGSIIQRKKIVELKSTFPRKSNPAKTESNKVNFR